MILVDTSVWIDFFTGKSTPQRRMLHQLIEEDAELCIAEIILTEILQGVGEDQEFERIKSYLLEFPIQKPRGVATYLKAAELYRDCRKKGRTVRKTVDCILAALCLENHLVLLHHDKDFDMIAECSELNILKG